MNGKMVCDHVEIVIVLLIAFWMTKSCTGQVNTTDKTNCSLVPTDPHSISRIKELIKDKNRIIKIELEIQGETGPLGENVTNQILNSKEWLILTDEVSEVVLQFPTDYMEKSLYTFSFHQASLQMSVIQQPENCFGDFLLEEILNTIRYQFLRNFTLGNEESAEFLKICNRFIKLSNDNGTGEIKYICCDEKTNDCTILEQGMWNKTLNICLLCIKYFLMAASPLLIPKRMYRKFNTLFRFWPNGICDMDISLTKMDIKDSTASMRCLEISGDENSFIKLKESIEKLPNGSHRLIVNYVDLTLSKKDVLIENEHPVSFIMFLFKNLVLCNMREDLSMEKCCDAPVFRGSCKWLKCVRIVMFLLMFCVMISPCWVTFVFYMLVDFPHYKYLDDMGTLLNINILKDVRGPSSLNTEYAFIAMFFVLFLLYNKNAKYKNTIESVLKIGFSGNYGFIAALSKLLHFVCVPLKNGFLRCLLIFFCGLPVWILCMAFAVLGFLLETVPLLVLINNILTGLNQENRHYMTFLMCCCEIGLLCYSFVGGFISIYIDCIFYTVLGILLNYDKVFQYICLIILFFGYTFNSFYIVSNVYLNFNRQLFKIILDRLNSCEFNENGTQTEVNQSEQNFSNKLETGLNLADTVPHSSKNHPEKFFICFGMGKLYLKADRLIVFFEKSTQEILTCISRNFFDKMCQIKHAAAPGSPSALYAKSFRDLIFVVVFFLFIVFVVFALGKAHDLSASVQTLLAVGGGVIPFVLQKVFKSRNKDIWPFSNEIWESKLKSEIDAFRDCWQIYDIDVKTPVNTLPNEIRLSFNEIHLYAIQTYGEIKLYVSSNVFEIIDMNNAQEMTNIHAETEMNVTTPENQESIQSEMKQEGNINPAIQIEIEDADKN